MNWKKFRKKPIVIEAFEITEKILKDTPLYSPVVEKAFNQGNYVLIDTLEGQMRGELGDWIIKGIKGEVYPCKPDIFKESYDEIS